MKHNLKNRRKGAAKRLEAQLKSGVKPVKKQPGKTEPLTEELKILAGPITKYQKKNRKFNTEGLP
jgi:hypothetical protein